MTLTARVMVGENAETAVEFPERGFDVSPGTLDRAARLLMNEDHSVNLRHVYPHIGFDAASARRHLAALAEERRQTDAGPEDEHRTAVKKFRITAKAIGLELIAGLFLSVLDSPRMARCACRAHIVGRTAVPYYWAPSGNPDARADYGGFVILAEVTTIRRFTMEDVDLQWTGACSHAVAVTERPRVYCLMVNRLGPDLRDDKRQGAQHRLHLAKFGNAPELLETAAHQAAENARRAAVRARRPPPPPAGPRPDVKFLLLHIEDMARIAHALHALYCGRRKRVRPLTEGILAAVLDELHAKTAERVAAGDACPALWASDTFIELLEKRVVEKKKPTRGGKAA